MVSGILPWAEGNCSFLLLGGDGSLEYYTTNSTLRPNSIFKGFASNEKSYPNFNLNSGDCKAWRPDASLDDFPYMPVGYFLDAGKRLLAMSSQYSLELVKDCNLHSKQLKLYAGSEKVLMQFQVNSKLPNMKCVTTGFPVITIDLSCYTIE